MRSSGHDNVRGQADVIGEHMSNAPVKTQTLGIRDFLVVCF